MCNDSEQSAETTGIQVLGVALLKPTGTRPGSHQQMAGRQVRRGPYKGQRPKATEVGGWNCTSCNKFHAFSPGLDLSFTQRIMNFCQGCGQRNFLINGKVLPNKGRKKCARPRAV